ncbi:EscS/YscS/HrcS family type III secretion system export apparatus protein [bacterium]|nr:EscS/YscS/HrcS family type III secretion system export apparatus protein [bacterium]
MTVDMVSTIIYEAVQVILLGSLPTVGIGLIVGLIVAIVQATTQIQEQTLTFAPKLVAVLLVLAITFSCMFRIIMELSYKLWTDIASFAR